jgi:multidrug efflux pump subunit AcrA (membrane-fusion protein)
VNEYVIRRSRYETHGAQIPVGWLVFLLVMAFGQMQSVHAEDPVLESCLVKTQEDISLPTEEAGVLKKLPWKEGAQIQKGDLLAAINDLQAQAGVEVAQIGLQAAEKRADSDIEVRYAEKASKVAWAKLEMAHEANRRAATAVPEAELQSLKLDYERLELQIEKAQNDGVLARYEVKTKEAELKAARLALGRREIRAPFDGEIVTLYRHESEWLSPGDPILRLVRFDVMYVEGHIDSGQYDPAQIDGRPVTVQVVLAHGRKIKATGKIIYINQMVQHDRGYKIRAEIPNQQQGKYWLIRPGQKATMTIHLN